MFKVFTTRFGTDPIETIEKLRKEFPKMFFLRGKRKDVTGIYCLHDMESKEYGESWELDNKDIFYAPTVANIEVIKNSLTKHQSEWQDRIPVKLMCGIDLNIFPASAIPRKVLFSRKQAPMSDIPFDPTIPYGKLAYDMYARTQKDEQVKLDDPMMMQLVKMALSYSYTLPEPLWDALSIVSYSDIDKIFAASMGMSWEFLQEEVGKSNAASQPTTGANAALRQTAGTSI